MPSLINPSFFIGDINIPNNTSTKVSERIENYISKYEPYLLKKLLGIELYEKLDTAQNDARIQNLIEGEVYDKKEWIGLVYDTNKSLIADYVYCKILEDSASIITGTANVVMSQEGGEAHSYGDKIIKVWNRFSEQCESLRSFLWIKEYEEFGLEEFRSNESFSRKINDFGI